MSSSGVSTFVRLSPRSPVHSSLKGIRSRMLAMASRGATSSRSGNSRLKNLSDVKACRKTSEHAMFQHNPTLIKVFGPVVEWPSSPAGQYH